MQRKTTLLVLLCLALVVITATGAAAKDTLDLDKAVKVGSGKTMVIEITDPDCPFCKRAELYFRGRPQVTRYIFFLPLASHPQAKEKVQYILSARDKAKAYLEVMAGRWDQRKLAAITPEGMKLQKEHLEIARMNNVRSTPTFMIYGRVVTGFDFNTLEPLLR